MSNQSRVFVVCEPVSREGAAKMDLSPAAEYGELIVLNPHSQSLLAPVPTVRRLLDKLEDFNDNDYILPVGDPVLMSTVAMVAARRNAGKVKFLKWDRLQRRYIAISVDSSGCAM